MASWKRWCKIILCKLPTCHSRSEMGSNISNRKRKFLSIERTCWSINYSLARDNAGPERFLKLESWTGGPRALHRGNISRISTEYHVHAQVNRKWERSRSNGELEGTAARVQWSGNRDANNRKGRRLSIKDGSAFARRRFVLRENECC